jgi:hypothetical protein
MGAQPGLDDSPGWPGAANTIGEDKK